MANILDYPLRFEPIYVEKIWGGNRLNSVLHKNSTFEKTGESWEISAVKENTSIIKNGALSGQDLRAVCEKYPKELMGERLTQRFDGEFPLLIKFLDAHIPLSVQVHPDDELAKAYDSFGKNEMWYILDAEKDAKIYLGFEKDESEASIAKAIQNKTLVDKIKCYQPKAGDVFHVPAKEVHAIGADVLLAEIQQTSDVTFRLYDWDRDYDDEHFRELHIEESLKTLNYSATQDLYLPKSERRGTALVHNPFFKTNNILLRHELLRNTKTLDSFVIYMVVDGVLYLSNDKNKVTIEKGETLLVPYAVGAYQLEGEAEVLEIYI